MNQLDLELDGATLDVELVRESPELDIVLVGEELNVEFSGPLGLNLHMRDALLDDAHLIPFLVGAPGPPGEAKPLSPSFSYLDGKLVTITYQDGSVKTLTYDLQQRLSGVDYVRVGHPHTQKLLAYNPDGTLASITDVIL